MGLYVISGSGAVAEVKHAGKKRYVEIPKDWDCKCVRLYKLREVVVNG